LVDGGTIEEISTEGGVIVRGRSGRLGVTGAVALSKILLVWYRIFVATRGTVGVSIGDVGVAMVTCRAGEMTGMRPPDEVFQQLLG